MIEKQHLIALANEAMPFGKYAGRVLIDLPEDYLLWFAQKGWPSGRLGDLLALALDIKTNGQETLLDPLRSLSAEAPSAGFNARGNRGQHLGKTR